MDEKELEDCRSCDERDIDCVADIKDELLSECDPEIELGVL